MFLRRTLILLADSHDVSLMKNIIEEICAIQPDLIQKVMGNLIVRLNECVRTGGRHLSDVILKHKMA